MDFPPRTRGRISYELVARTQLLLDAISYTRLFVQTRENQVKIVVYILSDTFHFFPSVPKYIGVLGRATKFFKVLRAFRPVHLTRTDDTNMLAPFTTLLNWSASANSKS